MNRTATRSGLLLSILGMALSADAQAPAKHPLAFDDLIKLQRISAPEVSPDGKWVAYGISTPDMEANRGVSNIWLVSTSGGDAIQLTQSGKDSAPSWSPDGKTLAFLSGRDGTSQVYVISMEGGEAKKLTALSTGADLFKWSPDGKCIAFTSEVYVDCKDDACNKKRDEEKEKSKVKAHVADHLLYRHWDHWSEGKRSHLFIQPVEAATAAHDLTEGADYDVPPDAARRRHGSQFFARRQRNLLHRGDRQDGSDQHKWRSVSCAGDRWRTETHHHKSGLRWEPGVLARRKIYRVSRADDAGLRSRPLASDVVQPASGPERKHIGEL